MKTLAKTRELSKNALEVSKQLGYNFKEFSVTENIIHYLRIGAFAVRHYHVTDMGLGNCGKSYCLKNTSKRVFDVKKHSEAAAFGSNITGRGYINEDNDVAFIDESANLVSSSFTPEYKCSIKQYTNGDSVTRDGFTTGENATTLYYAGNTLDEEQQKIDISPYNYSKNTLGNLPSLFSEEAMMERVIIIPSFLSSKLNNYHYSTVEKPYSKQDFTSILAEIREDHDSSIKIPFCSQTRDVKKAQKVITALIKFLYPNDYTVEHVEELYEISEFIVNLSYGKYQVFWNTEKGKRFIIRLCLNYLPQNAIIEDCYFLENRILIKVEGEGEYYKIALTKYGIEENLKEYNFFRNAKNKENIAEISEKSISGVVLKQRYIPILSKKNRVDNLTFLDDTGNYDLKINLLEKKINLLSKEKLDLDRIIADLIDQSNKILKYAIAVSINPNISNIIIPDFLNVPVKIDINNSFDRFTKKIKNELNIDKLLTKDNVGLIEREQEYQLINFANLIA